MRRRLFNLGAAVSLILCVATLVMWVRSYRITDRLAWQRSWGHVELVSARGLTRWWRVEYTNPEKQMRARPVKFTWTSHQPPHNLWAGSTERDWCFLGLTRWNRKAALFDGSFLFDDRINMPYRWLAGVTALLPVAWGLGRGKMRLSRDARRGHCPTCGYDLRATPGRCPECGSTVGDDGGAAA